MAGFYFSKAMGQWIETLMKDHKEADTITEESIRNIKTVASLGAEKKLSKNYNSLVLSCFITFINRLKHVRRCY